MFASPAKKGLVIGQNCRDRPDHSALENLANREAKLLDVKRLLDNLSARARHEVTEAGLVRRLARDKEEPFREMGIIARHLLVESFAVDARHHQVAEDRFVVTRAQAIHR